MVLLVAVSSALFTSCTGAADSVAGHTLEPQSGLDEGAEPGAVPATKSPSITKQSGEGVSAPATPEVELPDPEDGPILNEELHALRYDAQKRVLGSRAPPGPHAWPYRETSPDLLDGPVPGQKNSTGPAHGAWVPLLNEDALSHFHDALMKFQLRGDGKVRILAYGASHTQGDVYTGYMRNYLQSRFGNGGQGFVHVGRVNSWYNGPRSKVKMKGLKLRHAQSLRDMKDGPLGLFGAVASGRTTGSYGEVEMSKYSENSLFEVAYLKEPGGGDFRVLVDGVQRQRIKTAADAPVPAYFSFSAEPGGRFIRAQLVGGRPVRLLGLIAETSEPGIVVDTLGIGGARMANQLKWHEAFWAEAIKRRSPDLVIFAFGSNETMDTHQRISLYEEQVREVLARLRRAVPQASCLLMSPFDFPKKRGESWPTRARLVQILEVQERVAREHFCAFWDAYRFMGGNGSMQTWAMAHPPMARSDRLHLTPLGYAAAGIALTDAIMRKFDAKARAGGH